MVLRALLPSRIHRSALCRDTATHGLCSAGALDSPGTKQVSDGRDGAIRVQRDGRIQARLSRHIRRQHAIDSTPAQPFASLMTHMYTTSRHPAGGASFR